MVQKKLKIRQFKEDDLDQVISINRECLPENYDRMFFIELYKRFPQLFLVAEVNGRVAGYALCRMELGFPDLGSLGFLTKKGHIVSIAVLDEHRREGIGTRLMKQVINIMVENGAGECYLEVRVTNRGAIQMYEKLGFITNKRAPGYYRDGEDAFVMSSKLSNQRENADTEKQHT